MVAYYIGIHSSGTRYPRSISPCTANHTIPSACGSSLPPRQQRPLRMAPRPSQIRSLHQKFHGIQSYSTTNQGHISKPCLDNSAELRHLRSRPPYLQNPFPGPRHSHHHPHSLLQDLEIRVESGSRFAPVGEKGNIYERAWITYNCHDRGILGSIIRHILFDCTNGLQTV